MVKVINGTVSRPYYTKINVGLLKNVGKMRLTLDSFAPPIWTTPEFQRPGVTVPIEELSR